MKTILVIEDEQSIADTVLHCARQEGFAAVWRESGEDGLLFLREIGCDLVVLDVGLPDCNGFELCKTIRDFSRVPVVFLTARDDEVDKIVGLEIGADDYVTKPFSPRELGARIKTVLRRTTEILSAIPVVGNAAPQAAKPCGLPEGLHIDEERLLVSFKETPLDLTRYEFRLLSLLAEQPGRVFSRQAIMNCVWGSDSPSLDRTVDAHVRSLRAKFRGVDSEADLIITHRGFGYALRDMR